MITGETGTGKTLLLKSLLSEIDKNFVVSFTMFSARSTAGDIQNFIENNVTKRMKGCFGPDIGKASIFFIDDLSMPAKEQFGAQPPVEFLRKVIGRSEMIDRKSLELKTLEDVQYIAAMGGSNIITNRLVSELFLLNFGNYDQQSLFLILSTLLNLGFASHLPEILGCVEMVSKGTIRVFCEVLNKLPPTPTKSHYTFNSRDLSSVLKGLFLAPSSKLTNIRILFKLWVHECLRVFSDRLVDENDKQTLIKILQESL